MQLKILFQLLKKPVLSSSDICKSRKLLPLVDASFVEVPRQRNTSEENAQIKVGEGDELFNENSHKKRQKDIDAHWTKKNKAVFFGYKTHNKIDVKSKFIKKYIVTSAEVHDSVPAPDMLD